MHFECRFVRQQMIEAAIKTVFVDLFIPELQKIAQRRAPVPILGNVQFARRFAQPCHHQHGCQLRPRNTLLALQQKLLAQGMAADPSIRSGLETAHSTWNSWMPGAKSIASAMIRSKVPGITDDQIARLMQVYGQSRGG